MCVSQRERTHEQQISWLIAQGPAYWRLKSHAVPVDMLSEMGVDLVAFEREHIDPSRQGRAAYALLRELGHPYA